MTDLESREHRMSRVDRARSKIGEILEEPPTHIAGVVGFLSSTEREGRWLMPRHLRALAVLGSVELDLRDALIEVGVSVIEVAAVLGSVKITVPPEIAIECNGDAFLGNFTLKYKGRVNTAIASRERTIRVMGTAYGASVSVIVQGPEEDVFTRLGRNFGLTRGDK